jgi:hypothetical protein
MSDQDQVRPYHAKDVGSGQETADTLAEVLKHAREREQAAAEPTPPPRGQARWMMPLGVNLGVLAVYFLVAPPAWVTLNPIEPPPVQAQVDGLRTAIVFQVSRIDAYRAANGRVPESLEDCCTPYDGIEYFPRGASNYQLVGSVGEETVLYDSSVSLEEWTADLDLAGKIQG